MLDYVYLKLISTNKVKEVRARISQVQTKQKEEQLEKRKIMRRDYIEKLMDIPKKTRALIQKEVLNSFQFRQNFDDNKDLRRNSCHCQNCGVNNLKIKSLSTKAQIGYIAQHEKEKFEQIASVKQNFDEEKCGMKLSIKLSQHTEKKSSHSESPNSLKKGPARQLMIGSRIMGIEREIQDHDKDQNIKTETPKIIIRKHRPTQSNPDVLKSLYSPRLNQHVSKYIELKIQQLPKFINQNNQDLRKLRSRQQPHTFYGSLNSFPLTERSGKNEITTSKTNQTNINPSLTLKKPLNQLNYMEQYKMYIRTSTSYQKNRNPSNFSVENLK